MNRLGRRLPPGAGPDQTAAALEATVRSTFAFCGAVDAVVLGPRLPGGAAADWALLSFSRESGMDKALRQRVMVDGAPVR